MRLAIWIGAAAAAAATASGALAQSWRVGQQVEASPLMMNSNWEICTVTALLAAGDLSVACGPGRTEYVVQGKWVRAAPAGAAAPATAHAAHSRSQAAAAPRAAPGRPAIERPATAAAATAVKGRVAAPSGNYQCYGGAAGNMRITIRNGRWNEFYAEALPDGRVGVSSRPNGKPYYMICERR